MTSISTDRNHGPSAAFYSFNDEDALSVIRVLGPARMAKLPLVKAVVDRVVDTDAVRNSDLVIIQREFAADYNAYEKLISLARSLKKPVIHDLDDLLFMLPDDHPDRVAGNLAPAIMPLFQTVLEADLVTVPTEPLRNHLRAYNPSIEVIPNYLDDSLWKVRTPVINDDPGKPVTIGYMGSYSHAPDLLMILPALIQLVEKYADRIRYQFWGIEPPEALAPYAQKDWCPPPTYKYREFSEYFQQQQVDIVIAPLRDTVFNSCKSAIKFFEYSAIGAPGVYSRVPTYTSIIEHEKDGLLAATNDDWVSSLSSLIEDPGQRRRLIGYAQEKLSTDWLLSKNVEKRTKLYSDFTREYQPEKKTYPPYFNAIKALARQLYEEHVRHYNERQHFYDYVRDKERDIQFLRKTVSDQENLIQSLTGKVRDQENEIQLRNNRVADLENEVLSYATSRSWQLTRPLRRIMRKW